jgi:4-hydroxybenzoate polyprenyltransferase
MTISQKISNYIKITRPVNVIITFIVVVVAIFISQKEVTNTIFIILASISASLTAAAGNIINDILDLETDKISHPDRALVVDKLSKKEAWFYYLILNCASIIIAASLNSFLLIIVISVILLLFLYSVYLKRLPLIGNFTIAIITGLTFIYGGFAVNNPTAAIVPALFAFLINLIREIVKDIQDIEGDAKLNFKTFPILFGIKRSQQLIVLISVLLTGFTFYPFLTQLYNIEYFLIIMTLVNPLLVLSIKILFDKKENRYLIVSRILKLNMVLGLIAIWFGK